MHAGCRNMLHRDVYVALRARVRHRHYALGPCGRVVPNGSERGDSTPPSFCCSSGLFGSPACVPAASCFPWCCLRAAWGSAGPQVGAGRVQLLFPPGSLCALYLQLQVLMLFGRPSVWESESMLLPLQRRPYWSSSRSESMAPGLSGHGSSTG